MICAVKWPLSTVPWALCNQGCPLLNERFPEVMRMELASVITYCLCLGFCVWLEECIFPVCCCQHGWLGILSHVWTSKNPRLGQRAAPHPSLRTQSGWLKRRTDHSRPNSFDSLPFVHVPVPRQQSSALAWSVKVAREPLNHTDCPGPWFDGKSVCC